MKIMILSLQQLQCYNLPLIQRLWCKKILYSTF